MKMSKCYLDEIFFPILIYIHLLAYAHHTCIYFSLFYFSIYSFPCIAFSQNNLLACLLHILVFWAWILIKFGQINLYIFIKIQVSIDNIKSNKEYSTIELALL